MIRKAVFRSDLLDRPGHRSLSFVLLLGTLLVCSSVATAQPRPSASDSVEVYRGVVAAASRGEVFVMMPEGGIVAFDLENGSKRWQTSAGDLPMALSGSTLLALKEQPEGLSLTTIDLERQGRSRSFEMIDADTLWNRLDDGLGTSLEAEVIVQGRTVDLLWQASKNTVRGASYQLPPAPGTTRANHQASEISSARRQRGGLRIDLDSGIIASFGASLALPSPPPAPQRILEGADRLPNAPSKGFQLLSADGRHVLTSARIADERIWENQVWTIYERRSGRVVGQLPARRSHAEFLVSGSTIIFVTQPFVRRTAGDHWDEQPLSLRARRLSDGTDLWSTAIRDTRYYGPFPP